MEEFENYVYKNVDRIVFGFFSPKQIQKLATVKVVTPELYDKEGYPVDGGLMDIRMGVIDPGLRCPIDGKKLKDTPGYFGYIELARPVIHIKFVNTIMTLLKCTCKECGKLLIPSDKLKKYMAELETLEKELGTIERQERIAEIVTSMKTINKCPHCKAKQSKITIEKPTTYIEDEKRLSPIELRSRLEKIQDEDLLIFGINPKAFRPEWAVLTILSIPPVTMRPSITLESGERSEDDLTHKLGDIVRINQRLFENINAGAPEIIIEDLWDLLQYHVTTFFDNEVAQLPPARHRSGQPLKTISERIKSKEGRIRHNLAGKRTNFSARSVISPEPNISINEVGVPKEIAMKLTVPLRVNKENMEYLKEFIKKGPKNYPGANYITRPDGRKKKITDETREQLIEELEPGYIVERQLMDGDIALFNRQPSLHRMSMMAHKIRVLPGRTFRLNPSVCHPYNADFDGDEMNLHIPQNEEARAEAEILMLVQTQLISPRYGLSIIGCNQDSISGNYMLTKYIKMPRDQAIALLARIGLTDFSKLPKKDVLEGKDIFSMVLPDDFNFKGIARDKSAVLIKNGKLIEGVMDKANLGEGQGLMLRNIREQYGADQAILILQKIYKLGIETLADNGFTSSISDTDLPKASQQKIQTVVHDSEEKVNEFIEAFRQGTLEAFPGRSIEETLELRILEVLNKARNEAGKVVQENANPDAHTLIMATSGAKGGIINLAQMAACVGQQALRGRRIDRGYNGRTLSCFKEGDLSPQARGFIGRGFKHGLRPHEFFFMAMTGRDSLMDTALRTPKSGYLYRRLVNAMQDLSVRYDITVRDANDKIVQFKYGEDGIDVSKSENGVINVKKIIDTIL